MNYIHQNPVKGGLVKSMEQWEFSSYRDYTNLRTGTLCNKQLGFNLTGIQGFMHSSDQMTSTQTFTQLIR